MRNLNHNQHFSIRICCVNRCKLYTVIQVIKIKCMPYMSTQAYIYRCCCVVWPFLPFEDLFSANCDCNRKTNDYCDNDNSSNFHDIPIVWYVSMWLKWGFVWRRCQYRRPIEPTYHTHIIIIIQCAS